MSNWLEFLRSEVKGKTRYEGHTGAARSIQLWTNRGSAAARAVLNKYTPLLKAAETANARRKVEANFAKEIKAVENRDRAEYTEFMNLLAAHRQRPKPRASAGRPPRPSVARASPRNNLASKIRAEIQKATTVRNHWQKQINSLERKLNEILKKA